ncbi:hypothetical protein EC988_001713 [Linderina pennispora]|nr:hypothetical protein EC988_001713 [Linderina pennispora]
MSAPRKLSGLQKDVLRLYRDCLRAEAQPRFYAFTRREFEKNIGSMKRTDVKAIEYLMRIGRRRLEQYRNPNVRDIGQG